MTACVCEASGNGGIFASSGSDYRTGYRLTSRVAD